MFRVILPSICIGIVWKHEGVTTKHAPVKTGGKTVELRHRRTVCEIWQLYEGNVIPGMKLLSSASARCHAGDPQRGKRGDNFSKETGRKISLARALKFTSFGEAERREIWKEYFSRPRVAKMPRTVVH